MSGRLKELIGLRNPDHFEDWQESLIFEKKRFPDSENTSRREKVHKVRGKQAELARALKGGKIKTLQYLTQTALGMSDDERATALEIVPDLPKPLTIGEMRHLPTHAEREIATRLHPALTPAEAAEPAVWTLCHAVWINRGMFDRDLEAVFFEGHRSNTPEGRTRNFLRRTGGLRRVRGNVSPLEDCPISTAWWRYRFVLEIEETAGEHEEKITAVQIHKILQVGPVWSELVTTSLRKLTPLCAPKARAAVVLALHHSVAPTSAKPDRSAKPDKFHVKGACHELGRLSHGHNLWHVPWKRLVETARVGIEKADADDVDPAIDQADSESSESEDDL